MFQLSTRPRLICNVHQISSNSLLLTNYLFSLPSAMPLLLPVFPIFGGQAPHFYMFMFSLYLLHLHMEHEYPSSVPMPTSVYFKSEELPPPSRSPCDQVFAVFIFEVRVRLMICCRLRLPSVRRPCTPGLVRYRWGSRPPPSTTPGDPPGTARASRLKIYRRICFTVTPFGGQLSFKIIISSPNPFIFNLFFFFNGHSTLLPKTLDTSFSCKREDLPHSK